MKVINYLPYDDIGGVGYRTGAAFNRLRPDWQYHAYAGAPSYLQFPQHTPWSWDRILEDWATCDVAHVHDHIPDVSKRHPPTVVTFHGTGFRETPDEHLRLAGSAAQVLVSTLDLWLLKPDDTQWCPQMDDLDRIAKYRQQNHGTLRIGHAPTNRDLKSTEKLIEACQHLPVELVLIENQPWETCLRIKGTIDVLFDQTAYGYGGNAIEAWAMGIPVVCGAPDTTLNEYERRFGQLPFYLTTEDTLTAALTEMLNPTVRAEYAQRGTDHAHRWHSQQAGVTLLEQVYLDALG